jgi:hypothetical protein
MSDPELIDRILRTSSYRFRNVPCPNEEKVAKIAARQAPDRRPCRVDRDGVLLDAQRPNRLRDELFVERD